MRGIVIVPWFSFLFKGIKGMTLWPFILVMDEEDKNEPELINHENIHIAQQLEMLVLPFYVVYFIMYLVGRFKGMGHRLAYKNIAFEKEANANELDYKYLSKRKSWAWTKY